MSKQPFVLTPKNYPRPLKVLSEHAAVQPPMAGLLNCKEREHNVSTFFEILMLWATITQPPRPI